MLLWLFWNNCIVPSWAMLLWLFWNRGIVPSWDSIFSMAYSRLIFWGWVCVVAGLIMALMVEEFKLFHRGQFDDSHSSLAHCLKEIYGKGCQIDCTVNHVQYLIVDVINLLVFGWNHHGGVEGVKVVHSQWISLNWLDFFIYCVNDVDGSIREIYKFESSIEVKWNVFSLNKGQRKGYFTVECKICAEEAPESTGRHRQKSPPRTTIFPQKDLTILIDIF